MIYTVTGSIEKLGITLSHEHLFCDFKQGEELFDHYYNKLFPLLQKLVNLGIQSITEVSSIGTKENIELMHKLSKDTGINILVGTGLYYPDYTKLDGIDHNHFVKEMSNKWIDEFKNGIETIDNVVIRPSHIKIFVFKDKLTENEKKVLEAAIITSKSTGLPIQCHITAESSAKEVYNCLRENEFDYSKFLWAHAGYDHQFDFMEEVVEKGMWLGFDIIKKKNYEKYCNMIQRAIEQGYSNRILLSSDYDFMEQVESGEEHTCYNLISDFIPYCESRGIKKELLMHILTHNPSNFYSIK